MWKEVEWTSFPHERFVPVVDSRDPAGREIPPRDSLAWDMHTAEDSTGTAIKQLLN